jgi:hypothetical protein
MRCEVFLQNTDRTTGEVEVMGWGFYTSEVVVKRRRGRFIWRGPSGVITTPLNTRNTSKMNGDRHAQEVR